MDEKTRNLRRDLKDCANELCLKCGNYKHEHMGTCDGCRWLPARKMKVDEDDS